LIVIAITLLCVFEKQPFIKLMFEEFSAFGTVGLSTGITPNLSVPGKIIIILTMFFGRVGPMTLMFALGIESVNLLIRKPEEKIMVG